MQDCSELQNWKRILQQDADSLLRTEAFPPILFVKIDEAIHGKDDGDTFTDFEEFEGGSINQTVTQSQRIITLLYNDQNEGWEAYHVIWEIIQQLRAITKVDYDEPEGTTLGRVTLTLTEPAR